MNKLRLTKKEVCAMLSIKSDALRKLILNDQSFPRPIKEGSNMQSAVYFDRVSIEQWWFNKVDENMCEFFDKLNNCA